MNVDTTVIITSQTTLLYTSVSLAQHSTVRNNTKIILPTDRYKAVHHVDSIPPAYSISTEQSITSHSWGCTHVYTSLVYQQQQQHWCH